MVYETDQTAWLNDSLISNFDTAICNMNLLQCMADAVKTGYVSMDSLTEFVDSNSITKNSHP